MNIPEKVKVAGYEYTVERPPEPFPSGPDVLDGVHIFTDQRIRVARSGTEVYQNTVFLHEVVHAIIASYCGDNQNEQFVEQFSKGLYQVIADNPDIFK